MPHPATETFPRWKIQAQLPSGILTLTLLVAAIGSIECTQAQGEPDTVTKEEPAEHSTSSDNPVPFPRIVRLADEVYGPPPPRTLARLGGPPDWSRLDRYQHTMLRAEFEHLLTTVYAANDKDWQPNIRILPDRALIRLQSNWEPSGWYEMHFRPPNTSITKPVERYWTAHHQLRPIIDPTRPLAGLHILVDPGHIGGEFARTEARWYKIGSDTIPVMEGEMTLQVAKILRRDLSLLGARVSLSREKNAPVTPQRPPDLMPAARDYLLRRSTRTRPLLPRSMIESTAFKMFTLSAEIRSRATIINDHIQPDLALCLHFNAEAWGNPSRPRFKRGNHFHILVNGCYSVGEIAEDDHRLELMQRILQRIHYPELAMAEEIADSMGRETRLPPFGYSTPNARKVGDHPAVWARDLLANRKFLCPVVFFEPYIMNNREVHARVQEGEYRGLREFNGVFKKNIYQEYADAITTGLVNYFRAHRG